MALLSRASTWATKEAFTIPSLDKELNNFVNAWNAHDQGNSKWQQLKTSGNLVVDGTTTITGGLTAALPVASGGTGVTSLSNVVGTTNQVSVSGGTAAVIGGTVTLSTPQNIHTGATPTFAGETLTGQLSITGQTGDVPLSMVVSDTADLHAVLQNSSNTSGAHAYVLVQNGGASGGNPYVRFLANATNWSVGAHQSASGTFKISRSSNVGTNDDITIDTSDVVTIGKASDNTYINLQSNLHPTASGAGTLTNLPTGKSGNPTGYLRIQINGTASDIPFW